MKKKISAASLIFVTALAVRLLYMILMYLQIDPAKIITMFNDSITYQTAGRQLLGQINTGEIELYMVGPGYSFLLALFHTVFGGVYWPLFIVQILMSSLSCVLVYKITRMIIGIETVAVIAGLIMAASLTSISLASSILSDTLFYFLLCASLYFFFRGLESATWRPFLMAGLIGGCAVLVRSIATFFPIMMVIFALVYPGIRDSVQRRKPAAKVLVAVLVMIALPSLWGFRNLAAHDQFNISGTGLEAAKMYLLPRVLTDLDKRPESSFYAMKDSLRESSMAYYRAKAYNEANADASRQVFGAFRRDPLFFIKESFIIMLDNATAVSSLQHLQLPSWKGFFEAIDSVNRGFNNPVALVLSLCGFVILCRRSVRAAFILLSAVFYFAVMSGVTYGQGSRIFHPASIFQSGLIAVTLVFLYDIFIWLRRSIPEKGPENL